MKYTAALFGLAALAMAAPAPEPTAPAVLPRQVGGGLGGSIPGESGFLSGFVPASGDPFGCIGGDGTTVCLRNAVPLATDALVARQVGGSIFGSVPGESGFLSGTVPASGIPFGCIGGDGITICARETPAPERRQVGGGLGGSVPGFSGFLSGNVPATGVPSGCIGGNGITICAAKETPAPVAEP